MKAFRRQERLFFLLSGIYYCSFCSLFGYFVSILLAYGYTEVQCGWLTTIQYAVILIIDPVYGYLMDQHIPPKKMFIELLLCSFLLNLFLPMSLRAGFVPTAIMVVFISVFDLSISHVIDAWVNSTFVQGKKLDYGKIRSAGSVFYALTALLCGKLIAPFGVEVLFVTHGIFLLMTAALALFAADASKQMPEGEKAPAVTPGRALKTVMKNRCFLVYLVSMTLFFIATRSVQTFMQVVVNHVGGDIESYGDSLFYYCVGEFLVVQLASVMVRHNVKLKYLYIVSLTALIARIGLLVVIDNMRQLLLTQVLLSVGMGCYLRFFVEYVGDMFSPQYTAFSILTAAAITQGVGSILGNLLGGYLIDITGVRQYLVICTGLLVITMAIFIYGMRFEGDNYVAPTVTEKEKTV